MEIFIYIMCKIFRLLRTVGICFFVTIVLAHVQGIGIPTSMLIITAVSFSMGYIFTPLWETETKNKENK